MAGAFRDVDEGYLSYLIEGVNPWKFIPDAATAWNNDYTVTRDVPNQRSEFDRSHE
jgi:hypothetical protein